LQNLIVEDDINIYIHKNPNYQFMLTSDFQIDRTYNTNTHSIIFN